MKERFLKMVAAELKILRVEHNVSQEKLAEKSGVASSTISKYEAGNKDMNLLKIEQILKPYKISLPIFFARIIAKTQKAEKSEKEGE